MISRKALGLGMAAVLIASASGAAFAQGVYRDTWNGRSDGYDRRVLNPYYTSGPVDAYGYPVSGRGAYCMRLCPTDNNPCDPIQYKTADGRCGTPR